MTTRFIGLKELRQNMAKVSSDAVKKNQRLIILRKNVPLFELRPLSKKDANLERLMLSLQEAEEDVRAGRVYTTEQVMKNLGL